MTPDGASDQGEVGVTGLRDLGQRGRGRQILRACSLEVRGQGTEVYLKQCQGISARSSSCVLKAVSKKTSLDLLLTLSFIESGLSD